MARALALVAMVLALAACGGGGGGGALSLDPVAAAATKTAKSGGEHMTFQVHVRFPGPPGSLAMSGGGDFDAKKKVGRASLKFSGLPQLSGTGEEIIDGTIVYVRLPFLEGKLPAGKHWLKVDLAEQGRAVGVDLGSLMQSSTSDPTQMLRYLEAASTGVQKIGAATVSGVATTHYSAVIDFDKLAKARPKEKSSIRRLEQLTGVHDVPIDVWIDGEGYVRKMKESVRMYPIPQGPSTLMVMSLELSDFGKHVTVTPPPAEEVLDAKALAQTGAGG